MSVAVPFSAIDRWELGFLDAWQERVARLTREASFIGGEGVKKLESRLASLTECAHALGCANGTDALQIGLKALDVKRGDRVLVPNHTFWATYEAVVNVGAVPVVVDCDAQTGHVSRAAFESARAQHGATAAILVHLFGWASPETHEIRAWARQQGVRLLEDGAQAWGVTLDGKSLFAGAELATTSFYPGKVLGAAGDGGALFTQDQRLAERCHSLANHGRMTKYTYREVGWNSRLDTLQAAFVDLSLDYIDARIASRLAVLAQYRERLAGARLTLLGPPAGSRENGYLAVAHVDQRDLWLERLAQQSIGTGVVYPSPLLSQAPARDALAWGTDGAEQFTARVLNLPCFAGMTSAEVDRVCAAVVQISESLKEGS